MALEADNDIYNEVPKPMQVPPIPTPPPCEPKASAGPSQEQEGQKETPPKEADPLPGYKVKPRYKIPTLK